MTEPDEPVQIPDHPAVSEDGSGAASFGGGSRRGSKPGQGCRSGRKFGGSAAIRAEPGSPDLVRARPDKRDPQPLGVAARDLAKTRGGRRKSRRGGLRAVGRRGR